MLNNEQRFEILGKFSYKNTEILSLRWKGRTCWLIEPIGNCLGYSTGNLLKNISNDWKDLFFIEKDFDFIKEDSLKKDFALKAFNEGQYNYFLLPSTSEIPVLFETGLYKVGIKDGTQAGIGLLQKMIEDVLPSIPVFVKSLACQPSQPPPQPQKKESKKMYSVKSFNSFPVLLSMDEDGKYTATCPSFPSAISGGDTCDEAMSNIREAIAVCLDSGDIPQEIKAVLPEILTHDQLDKLLTGRLSPFHPDLRKFIHLMDLQMIPVGRLLRFCILNATLLEEKHRLVLENTRLRDVQQELVKRVDGLVSVLR